MLKSSHINEGDSKAFFFLKKWDSKSNAESMIKFIQELD